MAGLAGLSEELRSLNFWNMVQHVKISFRF